MEFRPAASRVSSAGPAEWFTGPVWMDELGALPGLAVRALRVTFAPGARTAWHAHPGGQVSVRPPMTCAWRWGLSPKAWR